VNLLDQAEADNAMILEDDVSGFGRAVTLTDNATPTPNVYQARGQVTRVGVAIDPGTGLQVPGNTCAITLRLSALGVLPQEDWSVETTDITGATVAGKVKNVMLDRTAGRVTFMVRGV
jgi:hypothetical protein